MLGGLRYGVWRYKDGGPTAPARILDHTSSWIALKRERPAASSAVTPSHYRHFVCPRPPRGLISSRAWRALELTVASLFE
ncbi:hypothetical protein HBI69_061630 [Parastagonospora nodorum]|nr:hypothetical protein HBI69_061630 [Parastagonospora nodorum]KAH6542581.1 hypothetical protein HBI07_096030 [Parastagonospora nodorum]